MKKGQVVDPGAAGVQAAQAAIDLLIPSDWELKGNVVFGGGKGGCFGDLFAVSQEATNPDGSIAFQGAPNYSWQYTDDPTELRKHGSNEYVMSDAANFNPNANLSGSWNQLQVVPPAP